MARQAEMERLQAQFQLDEAARAHEVTLKEMELANQTELEKYRIDMAYKQALEVAQLSAQSSMLVQASEAQNGANND
jgi:hypothetical protein